jgi:hypothetical protein
MKIKNYLIALIIFLLFSNEMYSFNSPMTLLDDWYFNLGYQFILRNSIGLSFGYKEGDYHYYYELGEEKNYKDLAYGPLINFDLIFPNKENDTLAYSFKIGGFFIYEFIYSSLSLGYFKEINKSDSIKQELKFIPEIGFKFLKIDLIKYRLIMSFVLSYSYNINININNGNNINSINKNNLNFRILFHLKNFPEYMDILTPS